MVARTVLPDKMTGIPILLMNCGYKEITIPANMSLTKLELVTVGYEEENLGRQELQMRAISDRVGEAKNGTIAKFDYVDDLVQRVHPNFRSLERSRLRKLLLEYKDIFSQSEFDLGETPLGMHKIDTGKAKPMQQTLRRRGS